MLLPRKPLRAGRWLIACLMMLGPGIAPALASEASSPALTASPPGALVGVVVASRTLDLAPKVEGRMETLKVRLGERVSAGQEVALLELEPFELELAARLANLKAAEADQAKNTLLLTQAQQRLEREKRIREYSAAEALETAETQVALAVADVDLAKARTAEAKALAASNLANARVRAPFSGVVSEVLLQPGVLVGRTTPLLRLVSDELRLRFAVPAAQSGNVRPGTEVRVRLEALDITVTGTVDSISPELDPASRHLRAEAKLNVPAAQRGRIPTGLLAQVELRPASGNVAATVP
jgi:RND family efflux transporter MFP subunit